MDVPPKLDGRETVRWGCALTAGRGPSQGAINGREREREGVNGREKKEGRKTRLP